ncbi:hypothetical protein NC653_022142 [Populus alba x Populus x berolinensis]|uniref:Uncharacterized protein n=2 Tax=Populus TaxID=3689 RepID=A0A4U5N8X8_POPAL|nr:hypothetical protein NC653_022142 [Populus alba x Populus x berolinensis]TKR79409.1 hypothetical protein D5086_0000272730 [Populus alba]
MVSFSATQQRHACPFSYDPVVRTASFLHQQLLGSPQLIFIPATSLQGHFFFSVMNCKESKINSPSNSNKLAPSAPATTALLNQRCNFFFSNTSSSFMQYSEPSSKRSSKKSSSDSRCSLATFPPSAAAQSSNSSDHCLSPMET